MASSDIQLEAGKRLARDLRAIRRSHAVDVKEVLDATRLPDDVIEQMEETALMGNPMFNRVYLRSMFSSYASILRIKTADMMQALEEAMSGEYVGSLAQKYLGEAAATDVEIESESEEVNQVASASDEVEDSPPAVDAKSETHLPKKKKSKKSEEKPSAEDEIDQPAVKEKSEPVRVLPTTDASLEITNVGLSTKKAVLLPNMSGFLMVGFAGIALIALIWFAVSWVLNTEAPDDDVVVREDTTQVNTFEQPERIVLPDSIRIDLIAAIEALDPIRVKIDRDLRRPFWIEHMERRRFEMEERVEFERELEHAQILIQGYVVPPKWYITSTRAEITRTQVQAWLDSLTTAGVYPPRQVTNE